MPTGKDSIRSEIIAGLISKGRLIRASQMPSDPDFVGAGQLDLLPESAGRRKSEAETMFSGRQVNLKLPGGRTGQCLLIRRPLATTSPRDLPVERRFADALGGARQRFDELSASPELCIISDCQPQDVLFLDIETCGLRDCELFLIGLMSFKKGKLIFEQFFARDYEEEQAVISATLGRLSRARMLVTFNGKAFDMRFIANRADRNGFDRFDCPPHLDLLKESRRRWRGQLPNFRLGTLERLILGRHRKNDIPSSRVPAAYEEYIRTGLPGLMPAVLHHNMLDLLSMAQLVCILLTGEEPAND